jgi:hypothetical protein
VEVTKPFLYQARLIFLYQARLIYNVSLSRDLDIENWIDAHWHELVSVAWRTIALANLRHHTTACD